LEYAVAAALGYLLGSIPFSLLVARGHGVNLYDTADGNPGAWNALEQLGPGRAWPAFAGDALKGAAGGLVGYALADITGAYTGVAAAMIGHAFPLFARFRGGKSVMTFVGGAFAFSPFAAAAALAACVLASLGARSFAVGARVGVGGFPLVQLAFDPPRRVMATIALMALIGLRFLSSRRRSAPATSATDAARST
jgi:acyl phosphate:glycerol-3-phosphate acyltransferase